MDKLSMSLFFGATSQAPLPPVPTWYAFLPSSTAYSYIQCFGANDDYFTLLQNSSAASSEIIKINDDATSIQSYTISASNSSRWYGAFCSDASGNLYFIGSSAIFDGTCHVTKYNSSMVKQWERSIVRSGDQLAARHVAVDSSLNVYTVCVGSSGAYLTKFDSAGTQTFTRLLAGVGGDTFEGAIAVDSSGSIYFPYQDTSTGAQYLVSYNSAGTLAWQRQITSTYGGIISGLSQAPGGGVYLSMIKYEANGTTETPVLMSISSTGSLNWTRWLADTVQTPSVTVKPGYYPYVSTDSLGNAYLCHSTVQFAGTVMKFDSAGTYAYTASLNGLELGPVVFSSTGNMVLQKPMNGFIAKVPSDGTAPSGNFGGNSFQPSVFRNPLTTNVCNVATTTAFSSSTVTMTTNTTALTTMSGPTTIAPTLGYIR